MTINKNPRSCKTSLIGSDEAAGNNSKLPQRKLAREKVLLLTPPPKRSFLFPSIILILATFLSSVYYVPRPALRAPQRSTH